MNYQLCPETEEIIKFMANIHKVEVDFLIDQLMIESVAFLLSDAEHRSPGDKYTFFEDWELPCASGKTIDDYHCWFKDIQNDLSERFNIKYPRQHKLFSLNTSNWAKVKNVAIDCLQDTAA